MRAWLCPADCAAWLRGYRSRRHPLCRLWASAGRLLAPPTAPAAPAAPAALAAPSAPIPPAAFAPPDSPDSLGEVRSQLAGLHLGASRSISEVRCELAWLRDALRAAQPLNTDPLDTSPLHPEAVAVEVVVSAVARRLFARLARRGDVSGGVEAAATDAEDRAVYLHREPPRTWCEHAV